MASTQLQSGATLEAFSHRCTEFEIRDLLQKLRVRDRERLGTHGHLALTRALEWNVANYKARVGVVCALLERPEIQVNLPDVDRDGNTALHMAVQLAPDEVLIVVRKLLDRPDLDPNVRNQRKETPLHDAAANLSSACLDIVRLLVADRRVNVAALNGEKQTALHVACKGSRTSPRDVDVVWEIIKAVEKVNIERLPHFIRKKDRLGRTSLHYAAENGYDEVVSAILKAYGPSGSDELTEEQDNEGCQAIHLAVQNRHVGVFQLLLEFSQRFSDDRGNNNSTLLHYAVRSGNNNIFQEAYRSLPGYVALTFDEKVDLFVELLNVITTDDHNIADFLLATLGSEGTKDYVAYLLHWAMKSNHEHKRGALLVDQILKWHPEAVQTALTYALKLGMNEPIRRKLMEREEVKEVYMHMHKARESYVVAANAILVVAVLIATLTYYHCLTSLEATKVREELSQNGLLARQHFHLGDVIVLTRVAFFLSMTSTTLAAYAALPFSFGFFFDQAVDDAHVKRLLCRTRVLIVLASYCLMLSVGALVFNFICSQFIAPYINYKCSLACEVALAVFLVCSFVFVGFNGLRYYWKVTSQDQAQVDDHLTREGRGERYELRQINRFQSLESPLNSFIFSGAPRRIMHLTEL